MSAKKVNNDYARSIADTEAILKSIRGPSTTDLLIESIDSKIKEIKRTTCRRCATVCGKSLCESCKDRSKPKAGAKTIVSGKGYHYVYDEQGRSVLKSRWLMEQHLGRKLHDYEQVTYKDGKKSNCVLSNLMVVVKAGTPIDKLRCEACGVAGKISMQP
jgi:hypothetical protein